MNNLANKEEFIQLKTELAQEMKQKLIEQGDPRLIGDDDIFDNYEYSGGVKNYYNRYMSGEKVKAGWVNKTDYDDDLFEK